MKILLIELIILCLIFCCPRLLKAQDDGTEYEITGFLDELSEELLDLKSHPLNINTASMSEMEKIPWLNSDQIEEIIKYRNLNQIRNEKQLAVIGIDEITLSEIRDYISFKNTAPIRLNHVYRLEINRSKIEYPSCLKLYSKTILKRGKLEAGFITQKDEMEKDLLDYYSYYLQANDLGIINNVIFGKYQIYSGQGILFSSKLGVGKSVSATTTPVKKRTYIKPYTSSYELWALEGVCADITLDEFQIIPFISKTSLSANLKSNKITSFNESGLHYDLQNKNNVEEAIIGLLGKYETQIFSAGLNYYSLNFDHEFADPKIINEFSAFSMDLSFFRSSHPVHSEIALINKKMSCLSSITLNTKNIHQLFLFRSYSNNFPEWHGNPFSSQSGFANETGFYYGITFRPGNKIKLNFYIDLWKFPETRYFEKMPTVGNEIMFNCNLRLPDDQMLKFLFKQKNKEKYISLDESKIRDLQKNNFRLDWIKQYNNIKLQTRFELASEYLPFVKIFKKGYLFSQLLKYNSGFFSIALQIAATDSDLLFYLYEYSVDGALSNAILKGNNIYYNLMAGVKPVDFLKLQLKTSGILKDNDTMKLIFQVMINF
ncbi:MAG: hypothetical protein APR54_02275 [Candidatus Cloacimonas sp. SDB]|nr:MAG: hypothetical protein APR54_02275 [Candidatus Cloacimonas sp. SDB]